MNSVDPRSLFPFFEEAGRIALEKQRSARAWRKGDGTPVTEVDLEIGRLAGRLFIEQEILGVPATVLDEESFDAAEGDERRDLLDPNALAVVLDPIGGTVSYMNGLPLFGIYLAVLQGLDVEASAVYLPALRELYYGDRRGAYFLADPFHPSSIPLDLGQVETGDDPDQLLYSNTPHFTATGDWMKLNCFGAASMWPLVGRGAGALMRGKGWDILPVLHMSRFTRFSLVDFVSGSDVSLSDLLRDPGSARHVLLAKRGRMEAARERFRPVG